MDNSLCRKNRPTSTAEAITKKINPQPKSRVTLSATPIAHVMIAPLYRKINATNNTIHTSRHIKEEEPFADDFL
jgi:hypothetical protein